MALGVTLRQLGLWNVTQPQGRGGEGRVPGPAPLCSGHPAGSHPPAGSGPPGLRCASSPPLPLSSHRASCQRCLPGSRQCKPNVFHFAFSVLPEHTFGTWQGG